MTATTKHTSPTLRSRDVSLFIPRLLQASAWIPARLLLIFFCKFTVKGVENVLHYKSQPILFVANHQSELDPIAIRAALPMWWARAPLCFVTAPLKSFLEDRSFSWRRILYGSSWFFKFWGAYPVVPGTGSYAEALSFHADLIQKQGACFLIFPEGKRVKENERAPIHGGAGYLASLPNVITVPVGISGFQNVSMRKFLSRSHHVTISFGEPRTVTINTPTRSGYIDAISSLMKEASAKFHE